MPNHCFAIFWREKRSRKSCLRCELSRKRSSVTAHVIPSGARDLTIGALITQIVSVVNELMGDPSSRDGGIRDDNAIKSRARMRLGVGFLQALDCDVGVYLGR
jgi:hypothetical protein